MGYPSTIETRVYAGPNLLSKQPVVSLSIPIPLDTQILTSIFDALANSIPAGAFSRPNTSQNGTLFCSDVTFALTQSLLALSGTPELDVKMVKFKQDQSIIFARYYDPLASLTALQASFRIAKELSKSGGSLINSGQHISAFMTHKIKELSFYAPDNLAHSLIQQAEIKNIPFRVFASASRTWLFGHGAESVQFFEAVTSNNGLPGVNLAKNKSYTNKIVRGLGLPATRWGVTTKLATAKKIAGTIGYPLVVKPVDGGRGQGVTADITQDAEFEEAFKKAAAASARGVIVENHVVGNDFRIALFGGRLAWVTKRTPAIVIGDGKSSVQELIDQENTRRKSLGKVQFDLKRIVVDHELVRVLRKQGYSLQDRPRENTSVPLCSVANISTGGAREDCTSLIHPDNVAMAECVARSFRLDAVGVDFITPDIQISWRECECAIIEVNGSPGFSTHEHARLILERTFVHKPDGRIPIVLALNCAKSVHDLVISELRTIQQGVGYVNTNTCKLDSHARGNALLQKKDKVDALLSDPACHSLVVALTTNDIEVSGLPVDRCALFLVSKKYDVPKQIKKIIKAASGLVIEITDLDDFNQERCKSILSTLKDNE